MNITDIEFKQFLSENDITNYTIKQTNYYWHRLSEDIIVTPPTTPRWFVDTLFDNKNVKQYLNDEGINPDSGFVLQICKDFYSNGLDDGLTNFINERRVCKYFIKQYNDVLYLLAVFNKLLGNQSFKYVYARNYYRFSPDSEMENSVHLIANKIIENPIEEFFSIEKYDNFINELNNSRMNKKMFIKYDENIILSTSLSKEKWYSIFPEIKICEYAVSFFAILSQHFLNYVHAQNPFKSIEWYRTKLFSEFLKK